MAKKRETASMQRSTDYSSQIAVEKPSLNTEIKKPRIKFSWVKIGIVLLAVAGVIVFLSRNKTKFMAAVVNGVPISRSELTQRVTDRFGKQMLEAMIGEALITGEANKQKINASPEEIKAKIKEIEGTLKGSMSLDESLKMQGITRGEFESQVRVQLLIDKMLAKEATVSTTEVDEYMKKNASQLTATSEAARRTESESALRNDKMGNAFTEWFTRVKDAAKIERYL